MNAYTITHNGRTFRRITRTKARRAYTLGLAVILCPCNLRPFGPWHPESVLDPRNGVFADALEFESVINSVSYHSCPDTETGRYLSYFIPVRTVNRFTGEPCPASASGAVEEYDHSFMRKEMSE